MKEDGHGRRAKDDESTPGMMVFLRCGCTALCGLAPASETLLVDVVEACPVHSRDLNEARQRARREIVSREPSTCACRTIKTPRPLE